VPRDSEVARRADTPGPDDSLRGGDLTVPLDEARVLLGDAALEQLDRNLIRTDP
jgi:hypothetical protein